MIRKVGRPSEKDKKQEAINNLVAKINLRRMITRHRKGFLDDSPNDWRID